MFIKKILISLIVIGLMLLLTPLVSLNNPINFLFLLIYVFLALYIREELQRYRVAFIVMCVVIMTYAVLKTPDVVQNYVHYFGIAFVLSQILFQYIFLKIKSKEQKNSTD